MNKVIAKEYVDKNYIHKDVIREILQETEEQIKEFDKYVKESTGEEKQYWRRQRAELIGARNILNGVLKSNETYNFTRI